MDRDQAHKQNELLERIAISLEAKKKASNITKEVLDVFKNITDDYASKHKDIPGFEGTLDALDNLTSDFHSVDNLHYVGKIEHHCGVVNDSDNDIRSTAKYYEECLALDSYENLNTKKDCILDYVTNEFGITGARYTDIIKFAYYLGEYNAPKYTNTNRGYYSCALNARLNGHLIQGGKDCLVKGINNEGNERYFALSSVDNFTDYYKRIS